MIDPWDVSPSALRQAHAHRAVLAAREILGTPAEVGFNSLPDIETRSVEQVFSEVCRRHNVSKKDVLSATHLSHIVAARHEIMACLRRIQVRGRPMSYPAIGREVRRDPTTVIYAVRKFADRSGSR